MDPTLTGPTVGRADERSPALDLTPFLGVWLNTNPAATGIARVQLTRRDDTLVVQVFGMGRSELPAARWVPAVTEVMDWGQTDAATFADRPDLREAATFACTYQHGFMEVQLHAWIKLGVLVIAKFDRFTDDSGRSNRFSREFFYRASD